MGPLRPWGWELASLTLTCFACSCLGWLSIALCTPVRGLPSWVALELV